VAYYNTLVAEAGYLSNVRLKSSQANGVTQADLYTAQAHAKAEIDATLSAIYDISTWVDETPGIIDRIADMLSSAEVLNYKYQRGDTADGEDTNLPSVIERDARALLAMVAKGSISLVQARLAAPALPSTNVPEAEFFPASSRTTSFGAGTAQNLEELYRTRGA
jgi:hypothetical protein